MKDEMKGTIEDVNYLKGQIVNIKETMRVAEEDTVNIKEETNKEHTKVTSENTKFVMKGTEDKKEDTTVIAGNVKYIKEEAKDIRKNRIFTWSSLENQKSWSTNPLWVVFS